MCLTWISTNLDGGYYEPTITLVILFGLWVALLKKCGLRLGPDD